MVRLHGAPQAFPTLVNPELSALPLRVRFLPINFLPRWLRALRVTRGKKFIRTRWHAGTTRWQARPVRLVLHFCDCKLGSKGAALGGGSFHARPQGRALNDGQSLQDFIGFE